MPHDCFADEIAIDFPSLEPAVERMRHAFLGTRADASQHHLTWDVLFARVN